MEGNRLTSHDSGAHSGGGQQQRTGSPFQGKLRLVWSVKPRCCWCRGPDAVVGCGSFTTAV